MDFKANHKGIQQFAKKLSDLIGDSWEAESYAEEWLSFGYSEGRMFINGRAAAS